MKRTIAFATALLAGLYSGRASIGQQYNAGFPDSTESGGPRVVQPVAYQTYLDDEPASPAPAKPARPKTSSASRSLSSVAPTSYHVYSGSAGNNGCGAPSCGANCGCNAPSCGVNNACGCDAGNSCGVNDGGCQTGCQCGMCRSGGAMSRAFGSLEYLFWWSDARAMPALVTTSNAADAGVLGQPSTAVLFGGGGVGGSLQAGGRFTIGTWFDDSENLGGFVRGYGAEGDSVNYLSPAALAVVARPFFNDDPLVNAQDSLLVTSPGLSAGRVGISAQNEVYGLEAALRTFIDGDATYRVDALYGFQYNSINDDLAIATTITAPPGGATRFDLYDLFSARNDFMAGSFGLKGEFTEGIFTLNMLAKIAAGNMHQKVFINGANTVTAGGVAVTTPGGLLAQPVANIGTFSRDVFAFSPEANIDLKVALTQNIDFTVGYTLVYWTNVALAGSHVDNNVNGTQLLGGGPLVGPATPAFAFNADQFWVQALSLGMTFRY